MTLKPLLGNCGEALRACTILTGLNALNGFPRQLACLLNVHGVRMADGVQTCLPSGPRVMTAKLLAPLGSTLT